MREENYIFPSINELTSILKNTKILILNLMCSMAMNEVSYT